MSESDNAEQGSGDARGEQVQVQHVTARVPDEVGAGVFSTGMILITGPNEFIVDFLQNMAPPARVVARVVMPHRILPQVIDALRQNLQNYTEKFGVPPSPPTPDDPPKPKVQNIYDDLKVPDEILSGAYANGLMITHTTSEFKLDFLTNLYPHSAVSCRVFLTAPQIPRLVESMTATWQQYQKQVEQQNKPPPDADEPNDDT